MRLRVGGLRNAGNGVHNLLGADNDFLQGLVGLDGQAAAFVDRLDGLLDKGRGARGRFLRLGGKVAHFVGDDGESLAGASGAGGLDCGVQGQNVGLERDVLDGLDNLADFHGLDFDGLHSAHEVRHMRGADGNLVVGGLVIDFGALGVFGGLLDGVGDFADSGGEFLHGRRLFGGALRHSLRGRRNLFAAAVDLVGGNVDLRHGFGYRHSEFRHSGLETGERAEIHFLFAGAHVEVAFAHSRQLHFQFP